MSAMQAIASIQASDENLHGVGAEKVASSEFVTVILAGQMIGLPILSVRDIFQPQTITRVPLAPPEVAGSLNLRGRIVTAIDRRRVLEPADAEDGVELLRELDLPERRADHRDTWQVPRAQAGEPGAMRAALYRHHVVEALAEKACDGSASAAYLEHSCRPVEAESGKQLGTLAREMILARPVLDVALQLARRGTEVLRSSKNLFEVPLGRGLGGHQTAATAPDAVSASTGSPSSTSARTMRFSRRARRRLSSSSRGPRQEHSHGCK